MIVGDFFGSAFGWLRISLLDKGEEDCLFEAAGTTVFFGCGLSEGDICACVCFCDFGC